MIIFRYINVNFRLLPLIDRQPEYYLDITWLWFRLTILVTKGYLEFIEYFHGDPGYRKLT